MDRYKKYSRFGIYTKWQSQKINGNWEIMKESEKFILGIDRV
jgi:hypothetical protein